MDGVVDEVEGKAEVVEMAVVSVGRRSRAMGCCPVNASIR